MEKVCVVIPVHSSDPSAYELISFKQCFAILNNYPIRVLAPYGLDLREYIKTVGEFNTMRIDPKWQSTLIAYNRLKTSRYFYSLFTDYEFILTYELDAFVFKDELDYWCKQDIDYIGAPWFEGFSNASPDLKMIGVGNSGFSLRRVESIAKALKNMYYRNPVDYESGRRNLIKARMKFPYRWMMNHLGENYTVQKFFQDNEDLFFGYIVRSYFKDFRVANIEQAIKFSFEVKPEALFELNGYELPMGCHAWWRYNMEFWRPYIERFGHKI